VSKARARLFVQALLAGIMLVVALTPPAEAQRGLGMGRNRQREQVPPKESGASEELAAGEYALDGPKALEAVNRGEGRQALAYYERAAAQSEQLGDQVRAARAWHVAAAVALRLARYQKAIQSSNRSIELYKGAGELTQYDLGAWASAYSELGAAYRAVGDLAQAQKAFEEGLALAKTRLSGRQEGQTEGYLLNGLAAVAFAQKDYQTALARNTQAAQFYEGAEARLRPQAPERLRMNLRRWTAGSFQGIGRDELALGHLDEADAAFDKALKYARYQKVADPPLHQMAYRLGRSSQRRNEVPYRQYSRHHDRLKK
jgi:tetratricopeptide (TPR) repeat protein